MWSRVAWGCVALLFFHTGSGWCSGSAAYLYVNSNTGAAAGGHVALKVDADVYHYQFFPDKRFLLVRESWNHFRLVYNRLRNRTIVVAELPPESATRIGARLNDALMTQQLALEREQGLRDQVALLETLVAGNARVGVPGLGFFDRDRSRTTAGARILDTLETQLGKGGLVRHREKIDRAIDALYEDLSSWQGNAANLSTLLAELRDLAARQATLDTILGGYGLAEGALVGTEAGRELSPDQVAGFTARIKRSMQALVRLIQSPYPGSGRGLLLQLARCHALIRSVKRGQLLTLDPYPDTSRLREVDLEDEQMAAYLRELRELLLVHTEALTALAATEGVAGGDITYTVLENHNGRLHEISMALNRGSAVRLAPEFMVPSRSGEATIPPYRPSPYLARYGVSLLAEELETIRESIRLDYSYNLISKNCVNELLRTVNSAFTTPAEAKWMLGGWIDPVADRVVIPQDFFYQVQTRYRVGRVHRYPSRRLELLSRLQNGGDLWLWFREANTLSSTLYRPRPEDTPFLFFTDDKTWSRPLLGFANLGWAALQSVGGLFTLPVDGGGRVIQGGRGMFYSLPELVFCNIRKGTYAYENFSERMHDL